MADDILWPIRTVSKDAGNASRLGTDGQIYTPATTAGNVKLDDLTDVTVATPATGQTIRYNGTAFVNAALSYADITGTPAAVTPSTTAGLAGTAAGTVGVSALYARADHSHPFPTAANVGAITQTQADARYVELAGDTMTGTLVVKPTVGPALPMGSVTVVGDNTNANVVIQRSADTGNGGVFGLARSRGTAAAPTSVQAGDQIGTIAYRGYGAGNWCSGGYVRSIVDKTPSAGETFLFNHIEIGVGIGSMNGEVMWLYADPAKAGALVGINWSTPDHQLEVGGTTALRGPLEVVGNITSSGTAHAFANGSIPSPAVIGNTPRTIAATGSAGISGQMVWDDNFIYLRTTSGWKKVALTAI